MKLNQTNKQTNKLILNLNLLQLLLKQSIEYIQCQMWSYSERIEKKTIAIDRLILHAATFSFHYQTKFIEKYEENRKQIEKLE